MKRTEMNRGIVFVILRNENRRSDQVITVRSNAWERRLTKAALRKRSTQLSKLKHLHVIMIIK